MGYEEFSTAVTNRSLRTVKTELDYLLEASVITSQQYKSIINNLPKETPLNNNVNNTSSLPALPARNTPQPSPAVTPSVKEPEKNLNGYYGQNTNPPPPAYPSAPAPPPAVLTYATALYAYNPQDTGDLAIAANDRIAVTEYMNAEWWKGRNERTGQEGIFPRSYVKEAEKAGPVVPIPPPVGTPQPSNYGNMPLDVSQSGGEGGKDPSKGAEMGKKFGKKLGNAAIFGAGATIGGKIVNGIF